MKTKGFKWNKFVTATTQKVLNNEINNYVIYGGNFFMELVLPNALKVNSFGKLKLRLEKYVKSHGGKYPQQITVNPRQRCEYEDLFPRDNRRTEGVPLVPRGKRIDWIGKEIKTKVNYAK